MNRQCGDCQLCCKLVPVKEGFVVNNTQHLPTFVKPAGCRCPHQKHGVGCAIYERRPMSCRLWTCAWLVGTALRRPDRSHYVVDMMPDYVAVDPGEGQPWVELPALQVWIDPRYPEAHRDPELRELIDNSKMVGLIRFSETDAMSIFPPSMTGNGWIERERMNCRLPQKSSAELARMFGGENERTTTNR
jgi:hypothetical protein